jgi:hypothetical protein
MRRLHECPSFVPDRPVRNRLGRLVSGFESHHSADESCASSSTFVHDQGILLVLVNALLLVSLAVQDVVYRSGLVLSGDGERS